VFQLILLLRAIRRESFAGSIRKKNLSMSSQPPSKGKIIVFGILFWYPLAGVTYQFLHYLIGLRRLGYDPYYIEDSGRWVYDPRLNDLSPEADGNIEAVLPALKQHGFGDRWAFHGKYPEGRCYGMTESQIDSLYREAACVVLASRRGEGLPNVLLEALAYARPVVATPVSGVADVVSDGVNGLLVPPGDVGALRAALARLFQERGLAERLGQGARATAERFAWERVRPALEEVLERWRAR